jgi:hypothetical protein
VISLLAALIKQGGEAADCRRATRTLVLSTSPCSSSPVSCTLDNLDTSSLRLTRQFMYEQFIPCSNQSLTQVYLAKVSELLPFSDLRSTMFGIGRTCRASSASVLLSSRNTSTASMAPATTRTIGHFNDYLIQLRAAQHHVA